MPSSKTPLKVRLDAELAQELHQLHPGYGEATRIVTELVVAYVMARENKAMPEFEAVIQAVKGRTA